MLEAARILKALIMKGSINDRDDNEIFTLACDDKIFAELEAISDEWQFSILRTLHDIYIIPEQDNEFFSVKLREIRENAGSNARNTDAYLQCYIIMTILWLFFGGKNSDPQSASSLRIADITEAVEARFKNENEATAMEEKQINFRTISDIWNNKAIRNEGRKSSKTQLVMSACKFLENHKLIEFRDDDDEIRPKKRLVDLMTKYYLSETRIAEINSIFGKEDSYAGDK